MNKKTTKTSKISKKPTNLPFGLDKLPRKTVRAALFVMTFALIGVWALLLALAATPKYAEETQLFNDINSRRAAIGSQQLFRSGCLTDAARERAAHLADTRNGQLAESDHDGLAEAVRSHCGSSNYGIGEIMNLVGSGSATGDDLYRSYMGSPPHKSNLENGQWNYGGGGVAVSPSGQYSYSAVIFLVCSSDCTAQITTPANVPGPPPIAPTSNPAPEADMYTNDDDNAPYACAYQSGWGIDRSDYSQSTDIHVYVDNEAPVLEVANKSNGADSGFQARFGTTSDHHGWVWTIPDRLKNGVAHQVRFAVIDVPTKDAGNNFFGTRTINCGSSQPLPQTGDTSAPTVPGDFRINGASSIALRVAWTASADDVGVTSYDLTITGGGKNETRDIGNITTYIWRDLSPNTPYAFKIRAKDASGKKSGEATTPPFTTYPAPVSNATPNSPTSLVINGRSAAIGNNKSTVTLGWSSNGINVVGYNIYRNNNKVGSVSNKDQMSYQDVGLLGKTYYTYYVTAYNASGAESQPSNYASTTTCYMYLGLLSKCP